MKKPNKKRKCVECIDNIKNPNKIKNYCKLCNNYIEHCFVNENVLCFKCASSECKKFIDDCIEIINKANIEDALNILYNINENKKNHNEFLSSNRSLASIQGIGNYYPKFYEGIKNLNDKILLNIYQNKCNKPNVSILYSG